jgi:succinate dehydrogenase/fumarate reductase cytochrome b subunit
VSAPLFSYADNFINPLGHTKDIRDLISSLAGWLVGLSALIALLSLVVGGMRLIIGGFDNEQEAAAAKKIITWAIIGLVVVGLAAVILAAIRTVLGI